MPGNQPNQICTGKAHHVHPPVPVAVQSDGLAAGVMFNRWAGGRWSVSLSAPTDLREGGNIISRRGEEQIQMPVNRA
jgi:hypothetical protein